MLPKDLPRCDRLDGSSLRIVPGYTEAGLHCEANCLTVTDGSRQAIYVPRQESERRAVDRGFGFGLMAAGTALLLVGLLTCAFAPNPPRPITIQDVGSFLTSLGLVWCGLALLWMLPAWRRPAAEKSS